MKLIKASQIKGEKRPFGRVTKELLSHHFCKSASSLTLYLSYLPIGKLDMHYHSDSTEIIISPKGGKITVNHTTYKLNEWDAILLEPGEVHGYNGDDCKDIIQIAIKLPSINDKVSVNPGGSL